MKKIILMAVVLLIIPLVAAEIQHTCGEEIEINRDCRMLTLSLSCTDYNYTTTDGLNGSIVDAGNLSLLNQDIYYFNVSLPDGDYITRLCDGSTREFKVRKTDENMLAIIIGIGIFIALLGGVSFFNYRFLGTSKIAFWVTIIAMALMVMEVIIILGLLYAVELGLDTTPILQVNFWIGLILGFGLAMTSLSLFMIDLMKDDKHSEKKRTW